MLFYFSCASRVPLALNADAKAVIPRIMGHVIIELRPSKGYDISVAQLGLLKSRERASPVFRMSPSPPSNPFDFRGPSAKFSVRGFGQPFSLTEFFTGFPTRFARAELLVMPISWIWFKPPITTNALFESILLYFVHGFVFGGKRRSTHPRMGCFRWTLRRVRESEIRHRPLDPVIRHLP